MGLFGNLKNQAMNAAANTVKEAAQNAGGKNNAFVFQSIPSSIEEFNALPYAAMSTPFETAAMTVIALCVYPYNADLSVQMLNQLRGPRPLGNMDLSFIKDRFRDGDHIPRSYFNGAAPENNYEPQAPYTINVFENPYSYQNEGYAKLFIRSGGADNPREVVMRLAKDGKWYLWDQMLLVSIRDPESKNPWA